MYLGVARVSQYVGMYPSPGRVRIIVTNEVWYSTLLVYGNKILTARLGAELC
jgi:hypothetical protein